MKVRSVILALFLCIFFLAPIFTLVAHPLTKNPSFYLAYLLSDSSLGAAIATSLSLAFAVTALTTALAGLLASGFLALRIPFARTLQIILLAPIILPPFVGGMGIRKLLSRFGPLNIELLHLGWIKEPFDFLGSGGIWAVALTQTLHFYPIILLNITASLVQFDARSWEAARLVGAGRWTTVRCILLPLIAPSVLASSAAVFVWSFSDISTPLIFDYRGVLPVQLLELLDELHTNPYGFWVSSVMLIITLSSFLVARNALGATQVSQKGASVSLQTVVSNSSRILTALFTIFASLIALLAILPHIMVCLMATAADWWFTTLPSRWTLQGFLQLLSHPLTAVGIKNSLILSTVATALNLSLAWIGASALLAPGKSWLKRAFSVLVMSPMAVPGLLVALGSLALFSDTILDPRRNPIPLLIIGYAIKRLPFSIQTFEAALLTIDRSSVEAAALCGASRLRVMRSIILPQVRPFIISCAALCFSSSMVEVSESFVLALREPFYPITKAMYALLARPDGERMAGALGVTSMLLVAVCLSCAWRSGRNVKTEALHS